MAVARQVSQCKIGVSGWVSSSAMSTRRTRRRWPRGNALLNHSPLAGKCSCRLGLKGNVVRFSCIFISKRLAVPPHARCGTRSSHLTSRLGAANLMNGDETAGSSWTSTAEAPTVSAEVRFVLVSFARRRRSKLGMRLIWSWIPTSGRLAETKCLRGDDALTHCGHRSKRCVASGSVRGDADADGMDGGGATLGRSVCRCQLHW